MPSGIAHPFLKEIIMVKEYNSGFKDRTEPKIETNTPFPKGRNGTIYDKRCGDFVSQGINFGEGVNQPIGTDSHNGKPGVPMGRVDTLRLYEER
jgi:hypothetical protein